MFLWLCKHIYISILCISKLYLQTLVGEETVFNLKTSFFLRCIQLLGIHSLKVINVQLSRKEKRLIIKYFTFVKIFGIFRLLKRLQGSPINNALCLFGEWTSPGSVLWALPGGRGAFPPSWTDLALLIDKMMMTASVCWILSKSWHLFKYIS